MSHLQRSKVNYIQEAIAFVVSKVCKLIHVVLLLPNVILRTMARSRNCFHRMTIPFHASLVVFIYLIQDSYHPMESLIFFL